MSSRKSDLSSTSSNPMQPPTFNEQVKVALHNYHDPCWLAEHSPLAAPYFLGDAGEQAGPANGASGTGERLQEVLYETATALWGAPLPGDREEILRLVNEERERHGKSDRYTFLVLELHYFRRFFQVPRLNFIWEDYLFIGKSQYYRDLDAAVQRLATLLLDRLHPSFRPELPRLPATFTGRERLLESCLDTLRAGQTLALSGTGGVGKTTLGAAIVAGWDSPTIFWFTVRTTFNDQLSALLFALGLFLHKRGCSALWRQVVAGKGKMDNINLALGLALHDLETLRPASPLLCFDEIDLLRPITREEESPAHTQLLEFIDSLRGHAPLLLIGQRAVLEADVHHRLSGLDTDEISRLLQQEQLSHSRAELEQLQRYTGGNPRLLMLCLALCRGGEALATVLDQLPDTALLHPLFDRLWKRLTIEERQLLQALSVFRTPAPLDAWQEQAATLQGLVASQLVQQDGEGGVALVPAYRDIIYHALSTERREQWHLQAAAIRTARGEYTAAAYHYREGGEAELAVDLWYPQREQEIRRGQAAAALRLFREISLKRLSQPVQKRLALLRAELFQFAGEPVEALQDLQAVEWSEKDGAKLSATLLAGRLREGQGQIEQALKRYEEGLLTSSWLLGRRTQLHVQRGIVYVRQKATREAWREATMARYEAEHLQGLVQETIGNYQTARSHYRVALALAEEVQHEEGSARTHVHLAALAGRLGEIEPAIEHLKLAISHFERVGDLFRMECARSNLAAAHLRRKEYQMAASLAQQALLFFQRIRNPYWTAIAASNLAEASHLAGDFTTARSAAELVLAQEEPQSVPYALLTLAHICRDEGKFQEAEEKYLHALESAQQNRDKYVAAYIQQALGQLYLERGRLPAAQEVLEQARTRFQEMQMDPEREAVERLLDTLPEAATV